jgi:phosphatidate phosphatase APP1
MLPTAVSLLLASWPGPPAVPAPANELAADEEVVLVDTVAIRGPGPASSGWSIPVRAWVFEPEADSDARRAVARLLADALDLGADAAANPIFVERSRWFLVDNERGKRLTVTVGPLTLALPPTGSDGHAVAIAELPAEAGATVAAPPTSIASVAADGRRWEAAVTIIGPETPVVVSDIDDTIKISEVTDRDRLLARTFLEPFSAVDGMPALYRSWADRGAAFVYLSSSPWQLYPSLRAWMAEAGFPPGAWRLQEFRWKDGRFLNLFASPETAKRPALETLLEALPGRRLVLIGDTGERDPEIYGRLARERPDRVAAILLRRVPGSDRSDARWDAAFAGVDRRRWTLFDDATEIARFDPIAAVRPDSTDSGR